MLRGLKILFTKRMLLMLGMGACSGLPYGAILSALQAWMTTDGISLKLIGFAQFVAVPYNLKFLWSPVMDRFVPPFFGRRRGWMVITQIGIALSFSWMACLSPRDSLLTLLFAATVAVFMSASQDIVLDAYRRDLLADDELGLGTGVFINGYRLGNLFASAGALALAAYMPWPLVYLFLGCSMLLGIGIVWVAPEIPLGEPPPKTLWDSVVMPLREYFSRGGVKSALLTLSFILLYKFGDAMAMSLSTTFLLQQGFSNLQIAGVAKTFGVSAALVGALVGGYLILGLGINRSLWVFGVLQALAVLGYTVLVHSGPDTRALAVVTTFEFLATGMATAAYAAFMGALSSKQFSATQYALLSSITGLARLIAGMCTGLLVEALGWEFFFVFCAAAALPGLGLLTVVAPWGTSPRARKAETAAG